VATNVATTAAADLCATSTVLSASVVLRVLALAFPREAFYWAAVVATSFEPLSPKGDAEQASIT
jgi:hypothetical protein